MCQYILDTDCVSLILYNHPQVTANATKHQVAVTIVTVQELFNGGLAVLTIPPWCITYLDSIRNFGQLLKYLQTIEILDFTPEAETCLKQLLKNHPSLRKNRLQKDMRIAAIALSVDATVVTRNQRDFCQVPGLTIEDWTF